MSRIIVKHLPKTITAKKLEDLFASEGTITDLQLKYNKAGVFRQFAFVGYKTEEEARAAKNKYDGTFVQTSKIQVEICTDLNDPKKPKSWKEKQQAMKIEYETKVKNNIEKQKKKHESIPDELLKDAKFKEFLKINSKRSEKPVWAEDVDISDNEERQEDSSSDSDYETNYQKGVVGDDATKSPSSQSSKKDDKETSTKAVEANATAKSPTKQEKVHDDAFTVKVRNLPFSCKKSQVKQFFKPLKIVSLRLPPKNSGFAYVGFGTEKDMKQALTKNKGYLAGYRVDVVKYSKNKEQDNKKWSGKMGNDQEASLEELAETGRIYVRNLCFTATEKDLEEHFKKYGPIADINLPIDYLTKRSQGFAFVTYVFAEHAVKAFSEMDGTTFQGRVLHLIPSKPQKQYKIDENETNYKKIKEAKTKQLSGSSHNWNILFVGMNAVADVIAQKYNVEKSKLLSGDSKESLAVRLALAETETVMANRKFLTDNGVKLDAFSQADAPRSDTVMVVKNLPSNTTSTELEDIFSKHGALSRVLVPPSGLVGLVEFQNPSEAKVAFRRLAYSRFRQLPLYLEWAPMDALGSPPEKEDPEKEEKEPKKEEEVEEDADREPEANTTIFVKYINFNTTQEDFYKHFEKCGPLEYATISTKKDKTGHAQSMGYGFVQFKDRDSAVKCLQNMQMKPLDGHSLELHFSNRATKPTSLTQRKKYEVKKQTSAKILVKNLPFHSSEKEIRELFSAFGSLKSVRMPKKPNGEYRGFGFVEFHTKDNAARAFNALSHSTHFFGRRLVLEWANPESEDIDELRQKTARDYVPDRESKRKVTKRKLNEDVALAEARYGEGGDD